MSKTIRLAQVQMADAGSPWRCVDRAIEAIQEAAQQNANLVCLQELFNGPYPCQSEDHAMFDLAEPIHGPTIQRLSGEARKHGMVIVAPIFERRAAGLYHNTAVVLEADGSIAGFYRKMHIPDDPLFYEKFYFTPGDAPSGRASEFDATMAPSGFHVIPTSVGNLGVGICWDQWFPEAARLFAIAGADILLYPTAIGWIDEEKQEFGASQLDAWITVMRSHAIANGLFVAATNRVGMEGKLEFWGNSFVASPTGEIMNQAGVSAEETIVTECSTAQADGVRTHWPFLRDRRIDAYHDLTRRWIDCVNSENAQASGGSPSHRNMEA